MYQLFNGYHLGSNRALFVVAPRPHTVSEPGADRVQPDRRGAQARGHPGGLRRRAHAEVVDRLLPAGRPGHRPPGQPAVVPLLGLVAGASTAAARRGPTAAPGAPPPVPRPSRRPADADQAARGDPPGSAELRDVRRQRHLQMIQLASHRTGRWCMARSGCSDVAASEACAHAGPSGTSPDNRAQRRRATLNAVQSQVNRLMLDRNTSVGYQPRSWWRPARSGRSWPARDPGEHHRWPTSPARATSTAATCRH